MQIISGLYKGHKLRTSKNIRPTMGRTREAVFNILLHNDQYFQALHGGKVLDMFCGSGAMGLESLSHGAKHVFMMDIDVEDAYYNTKLFSDHVTIMRTDASNPPKAHQSCNLVFIDPPYGCDNYDDILLRLRISGWVQHNSIVVMEIPFDKEFDQSSHLQYELLDERKYGKAKILILSANMAFDINEIRTMLMSTFHDAEISLEDTAGDADHFSLVITSSVFRDKSMVEQHKLVYQALEGKVGYDIHALQLKTIAKEEVEISISERIKNEISEQPIVLFMKGDKKIPCCGFSAAVVSILQEMNVDFKTVNVLQDDQLREGIKNFSDWPTIPQLYVRGEFIGGCDIVQALYKDGQLHKIIEEA